MMMENENKLMENSEAKALAGGSNLPEESNEEKLSRLAGEINAIKEQTREVIRNATLAIGERLIQAKAVVPHGGWGTWLKNSVDYSERTAQMLMSAYERFGTGQQTLFGKTADPELVAQLNRSQIFALMSIRDEDDCMEFMEEHREELSGMSKRELEKAIRERDEARRAAEESSAAKDAAEKSLADTKSVMEKIQKELEEAQAEKGKEIKDLEERYHRALDSAAEGAERKEREYKELEEGLRQRLQELQDQSEAQAAELQALRESKETEEAGENGRLSELEEQNTESAARIRELEQELEKARQEKTEWEKEKETAREETQRELEEIREQVDQEKKQAESGQRFAVIFQMVQGAFNDLLGITAGMGTEEKEKYKNACRSMAQAMEKAVDDI